METKTLITVVGKIHHIGETQSFNNGKFKKLQFVVVDEVTGKWAQYFPLTLKNEDISQLRGWKVGDEVAVSAFVNGTKWDKKDANGKVMKTHYFTELVAASIRDAKQDTGTAADGETQADTAESDDCGSVDDIPF